MADVFAMSGNTPNYSGMLFKGQHKDTILNNDWWKKKIFDEHRICNWAGI